MVRSEGTGLAILTGGPQGVCLIVFGSWGPQMAKTSGALSPAAACLAPSGTLKARHHLCSRVFSLKTGSKVCVLLNSRVSSSNSDEQ